jgi:hypothetical protein
MGKRPCLSGWVTGRTRFAGAAAHQSMLRCNKAKIRADPIQVNQKIVRRTKFLCAAALQYYKTF